MIAVGGLIYSLSPMCPPATRWPQRVCYGVMLYLAWWCPWPGWVIFLTRRRMRHTRPLAIADLRGRKDEASRAGTITHVTSFPLLTGHWSGREGHWRGIGNSSRPHRSSTTADALVEDCRGRGEPLSPHDFGVYHNVPTASPTGLQRVPGK